MSKINPLITQQFTETMKRGEYQLTVKICGQAVPLLIYPGVFPPQSDHSISSISVAENLGDLTGMRVADIGCGSGFEAISAAILGAELVDATDITETAVECTKRNVELNGLQSKITVCQGDLFSSLPNRSYDLIIANLPIVDFEPEEKNDITCALYDPGHTLHHRLLHEAKGYLAPNGSLTFTHANLQSAGTSTPFLDFVVIEEMVFAHGYRIAVRHISEALGYRWICYRIQSTAQRSIDFKRGIGGRNVKNSWD